MSAESKSVTQNLGPIAEVRALLERSKNEIAAALPKHLTAERMTRLAMTELRQNPSLLACEPRSFLGAVIQSSQLGLEIGSGLGQVYLVPFNNSKKGITECQMILGYRGMIALARRSGEVSSIAARIVREGDTFDYSLGLEETLEHKPSEDADRESRPITHVYAIAFAKDGGRPQFEVLSFAQIEKVRMGSKQSNTGPWRDNYEEMAKKTAVRKLFKFLPLSIEMQAAERIDSKAEAGVSQDTGKIFDLGADDYRNEPEAKKKILPKGREAAISKAVSEAEGRAGEPV